MSRPDSRGTEAATLPGPPRSRPAHLQGRLIALVALGGAVGTGVRRALGLLVASAGAFPTAIFVINLTGAFLLGLLLEWLVRSGPDVGRRRDLRLFAGTGVLGGYTTYSSLAVGSAQLLTGGHPVLGGGYALGSVVLGVFTAYAGIALSGALHRAGARRAGAARTPDPRAGAGHPTGEGR